MSLRLLKSEVLADLKTDYFIETGTLNGDGIDYALELDFLNIISIDIWRSETVYEKFKDNKRVRFINGDSGIYLWEAIKDKNQKLTLWLDAHAELEQYPNQVWAPICPILEELSQIQKHHIKDHHILVDDITPIIKIPGITKAIIEKMIMEINKNYRISYADTGGTQTLIASTNGIDYNCGLQAYK